MTVSIGLDVDLRRSRIGIYERERGLASVPLEDFLNEVYKSSSGYQREINRALAGEFWKEAYAPFYKGRVKVDGKTITLIELPKEYLPRGVLGMTDGFSTIWLRNDLDDALGYGARERVLEHEKEHIRDPTADEMTVRRRTNTVSIGPYSSN